MDVRDAKFIMVVELSYVIPTCAAKLFAALKDSTSGTVVCAVYCYCTVACIPSNVSLCVVLPP